MRIVHAFPGIFACLLVSASCAKEAEPVRNGSGEETSELEELRAYLDSPQYGRIHPISGKAMFGQETSIVGVCENARDVCKIPLNADGSEQPCWLVFTKRSSADIKRIGGKAHVEDGEFWIDGEGRVAVRPGEFGHLGGYTCQVEMTSVREFESGPPHFWEPPPPE